MKQRIVFAMLMGIITTGIIFFILISINQAFSSKLFAFRRYYMECITNGVTPIGTFCTTSDASYRANQKMSVPNIFIYYSVMKP